MSREAMKLALEALVLNNDEWKSLAESGDSGYWKAEDQGHYQLTNEAIFALREALVEQPERPYRQLQDNGSKYFGESWDKAEQPAQQALDKMADNAKELGLDYEPATYAFKTTSAPVFALNTKPNHNMTFHNQDGKQVGTLDFNGPEMVFTGDMDESVKVFFEFIANAFKQRLEQERADEREACAKVCDDLAPPCGYNLTEISFWDVTSLECADAIRARSNT